MRAGHKTSETSGGRREAKSDIVIFFVDLVRSQAALDAEEARAPRLSNADAERASEIADGTARRLWRASRIATRLVLEHVGGPGLRRMPFRIEPGGRPRLGEGDPYFSISHTGGAALIAVSCDAPVGVDLEESRRNLRMSGDRRRQLIRAAERLGSRLSLSADRDGDVLAAWVQLEAAAKASGTGIGRLLALEGVIGGSTPNSGDGSQYGLEVRCLPVEADYIAAVASKRLPDVLTVEPLPHADLAAFLTGRSG